MRSVVILARRDLRARWRGWLSVALLLAVAGGAVLTAAAGARRTDTAYARFLRSAQGADVEIAVSGPGGRQNLGGVSRFYAAVAALPGVSLVAPTVGVSAVAVGRADAAVLLKAGTNSRLGRSIERPKLTEGRMFDPTRRDEVVADRTVAAQLHLHVGSALNLEARPPGPPGDAANAIPLRVHVVGVAVTRDNVIPVTALAAQGSLLVTPALLRGLRPDLYAYDAAFVHLERGVSVAAFRRATRALVSRYPETGGQLFVVDEHQQAGKVEAAIHPQAIALALFALLVALTSVLVIGHILVRRLVVNAGDASTLRALGLRRAQLAGAGLAEVGVAVAVGALMAVLVATALTPLMPIGPARVAEPHPGLAFNWAFFGVGAVVIVVVFLLCLAVPVWRLAVVSTKPDGVVFDQEVERPSIILNALTRTGAPVSAAMGARLALDPGRGRTAVPVRSTLVVTAIAVAAMAAAFTFGTNLVRLVNTPRLYGQAWQVSVDVEFGQMARPDVETFLRRQRGVSGWTLGNHAEAVIAGHRVAAIELTRGDGPATFPTLLEGRAPQAPDEIVLGTKTLAAARRQVGQMVAVALQGEKAPRAMRVVGRAVFPFFGQGEVTPTGLGDGAGLLDRGPNPDGFNLFLVTMIHGPAQGNIARLARNLKPAGVCHQECTAVTVQRPSEVNNYARIRATPIVLSGVFALLAIATFAHLLVTSTRRRRRDFAVLKTLGFVRHQVSAAVAWQASIVVTLALLVGLPVGVAVGRWAWLFFGSRLGVAPDPQVPLLPMLLAIPAALAIATAAAAVPGRLAARLRPGQVLRTD